VSAAPASAPEWLLTRLATRQAPTEPSAAPAAGPAFRDLDVDEQQRVTRYAYAIRRAVFADLDGLRRPWAPGAAWDDGTFRAACSLLDLAESAWAPYTREDALADLDAHAPRDHAWGRPQHRAKVASADRRTSAGQGRPYPSTDPFADGDMATEPSTEGGAPTEPVADGPIEAKPKAPSDPLGVVDLTPHLDGTWEQPRATLLPLADRDGAGLVYPGETHSVYGPPGTGKSWVAIAEGARVLSCGGTVAYLDFESSAAVLVSRMRALGVPEEALRERLTYARPDSPFVIWKRPQDGNGPPRPWPSPGYAALLRQTFDFVVLDGVTAALSLFQAPSDDGDAYSTWHRTVPQKIAQRTGAAVLMVDHVTKASDSRGRFAIGSQSKLALISGAAYAIDVEVALGPGHIGRLLVKRTKDRHGAVEALVAEGDTNPLPTVAVWTLDATSAALSVDVRSAAAAPADSAVPTDDWADPDVIRAVVDLLQANPLARYSQRDLQEVISYAHQRQDVRRAIGFMLRHGALRQDGPPKPRSTYPTLRLIAVGDPLPSATGGAS